MGAFLLGLIVGFGASVGLFLYDQGELFIKLGNRVRDVTARYKQQQAR